MGNNSSTTSVLETAGLEENIQDILKKREEQEKQEKLDPELVYNGEYTELKITKASLKWRIAKINSALDKHKNVKASLEKFEVKLDKIYGLEVSSDLNKFTVYALGRRDDALSGQEGSVSNCLKEKIFGKKQQWFKNEYTFEAKSENQASQWLDEICEKTGMDWEEQDVLLVYQDDDLQALEVLREIKPMFKAANIMVQVLKGKNIQDKVYSTTLLCQYRHLVVLGGDKVFHKAVNGILTRPDFDRVTQRVVVSAIPTEFGNNAVSKFMGVSHPYLSVLTAIRGKPQPFDIMSVVSPSGFRMFSHLNFHWGLISDIQLDPSAKSEGKVGFNLNTLVHTFSPRRFQGTLHYLPVTDEESIEEGLKPAIPVSVSTAERLAKPGPINHLERLDPNNLPEKWVTVNAAFSLFFATNISRLTPSLVAAPLAITSDGAFDIAYTQAGFWNFLQWILFPERGSHLSSKSWNFARAKAFILEPGKDLNGLDGCFTVDGEKIPYTSVRCEVHKGAIAIQTPMRKIESRAAKWKANLKRWGTILSKERKPMITFEEFKIEMVATWMLSFGILILILAFFWNL